MGVTRKRWLTGLTLALLVLAGLAFALEWDWVRKQVEQRVTAQTGRTLAIESLRVRLGFPTRVRLKNVRFDNPAWAAEPQLLAAREAEFTVRLAPLLLGRIVLPEVRLVQPQINLERNAAGAKSWTLAREDEAGDSGEGRAPVIGRLAIDAGVLRFRDPATKTAIEIAAESDGRASRLRLHASGTYRGRAVDAEVSGDPALGLADTSRPYAFEGRFKVGPTQGTLAGSVTGLVALAAADLALDVRGESLAELYPLLPLSLPATPPYHIKGHLMREGKTWRFHDFTGRVGDSDLAGDADFTRGDDGRPHLRATVESKLLDFNDLGGLIGAPPGTGRGETASPAQEREARQAAAKPTLLPDKPLKLDRLNAMDAVVHFKGRQIRGRRTPLDDLEIAATLERGVLRTAPLNFGIAGGEVASRVTLDARQRPLRLAGDFEFRRLDLGRLFPKSELAKRSSGLVGGRAVLDGEGNSFAEMLASADGKVGLALRGGRVSNLLLEAIGLDAAEVVRFLFAGDKTVPLRCAVAEFAMNEGVLETRSVVVDTKDTQITAEGRISLRDETLDLTLYPVPKDYSPLSLRSPLHVEGSFKDPEIALDDNVLLKGGIAAVLAAIAVPLAALVPLIETGPGDNADCAELTAAAERYTGTRTPAPPTAQ